MSIQYETKISEQECCPICHGHNLRIDLWVGDEGEEFEAVECKDCWCGAPATVWNNGRVVAAAIAS